MKKIIKSFGFVVVIATIGLGIAACDNGSTTTYLDKDYYGIWESLDNEGNWPSDTFLTLTKTTFRETNIKPGKFLQTIARSNTDSATSEDFPNGYYCTFPNKADIADLYFYLHKDKTQLLLFVTEDGNRDNYQIFTKKK